MAQPKYNKKFKSIKGKQMAYIDEGMETRSLHIC